MGDVGDMIVLETVGGVCVGMWLNITQWESSLPDRLEHIHKARIVTPADTPEKVEP